MNYYRQDTAHGPASGGAEPEPYRYRVNGEGAVAEPRSRRTDLPVAEHELDADLTRAVKQTTLMRQGFYVVVALVALAGQVSGAVETLHIPLLAAVPAVAALELGGIVVLANADVRRRLGERAVASRLLSAAIAVWAVAFNWLAHANHLLGGFFAGMSALGYLVWLMHTENQRRDRLRAKGALPPTTPAYELVGHWLSHPWVTRRARSLAKADPGLGLYESLELARANIRQERRHSSISKVLHRKIRAAVDPTTANIAVAVYDLDEIAARLAAGADYEGLTALIAADLAPARIAANVPDLQRGRRRRGRRDGETVAPTLRAAVEHATDPTTKASAVAASERTRLAASIERPVIGAGPAAPVRVDQTQVDGESAAVPESVSSVLPQFRAPGLAAERVEEQVGEWGHGERVDAQDRDGDLDAAGLRPVEPVRVTPVEPVRPVSPAPVLGATVAKLDPDPVPAGAREGSLRGRVYAALDAHVPAGDSRENGTLIALVAERLQLTAVERSTAATYVRAWRRDVDAGRRTPTAGRRLRSVQPDHG